MNVTINIWSVGGIVVLAILIGYLLGRMERKGQPVEEMPGKDEETSAEIVEEKGRTTGRHSKKEGRRIRLGKSIVSPVAGNVSVFYEDGRKGVVIEPEQGSVYAPVAGKIIKIYPMGNAFLLRTEEAEDVTELLIRVGRQQPDELCSMYYRPRVVQNEIVTKGKLLLLFDKECLKAAGEETTVTVSIVNSLEMNEVNITQEGHVKVGDDLMRIDNVEMAFTV